MSTVRSPYERKERAWAMSGGGTPTFSDLLNYMVTALGLGKIKGRLGGLTMY